MMFLEFFVWGGWGVALAGYADQTLKFEGWQVGMLMGVTAVGAIVSPLFVGLIADRFFATERVLCVLHILGGAALLGAGGQTQFAPMMFFMMITGLLFMPTIALVNALSFRHLPDPDKFPRIAVFGTIGWICALVTASVFLGGATERGFFIQSGIGGIVLGLYCLTLPHTPPKGGGGGVDAFGLQAMKLLKESSFLVFLVCVFLFSIPACPYFFALQVPMLQQRGYPSPLALTTLNQFSELIFMFSMPWFVAKLGLKRVLMIGMLAWVTRYLFFSVSSFPLALVGLILHGFCYSFFYVGAYMWMDKRAPEDLKASGQSLLAFLLLGVGWFLGAWGGGSMMDLFPAPVGNMAAVVEDEAEPPRPLPPWDDPKAATSAWRYLDLSGTVKRLLRREDEDVAPAPTLDLAQQVDKDQDGTISLAEIRAIPVSGLKFGDHSYSRDELIAAFTKIARLNGSGEQPDDDFNLTRQQWLDAQSAQWKPIWLWPSGILAVLLVLFALAFHDKPPEDAKSEDAST
jgi:nucleoside transporter